MADKQKRRDVLNYLRATKAAILCIQDIHIEPSKVNCMLVEWGLEGVIAPGTNNSRGTAILFNNNFQFKIHNHWTENEGNYVIIDISMIERRMTLVTLYGPNQDNPRNFKKIFKKIREIGNDDVIIVGDWNLVINPDVDYSKQRKIMNKNSRQFVLNKISEFNLVDIWRIQHKDIRQYTWHTKSRDKQSRLDFFLVSEHLVSYILDSNIEPGYRTDHSIVSICFDTKMQKKGKGLWKLNVSLLRNSDYTQMVRNTISDYKEMYAATPYDRSNLNGIPTEDLHLTISWKLFLDTLLMAIRGNSISFASYLKRETEERERSLNKHIRKLCQKIENQGNKSTDDLTEELQEKEKELEELRKRKIDALMTRSRVRWYEQGEKNTSYFFRLEKRNYTEKRIINLIRDDGEMISQPAEIMQELHKFYTCLYNESPTQNANWAENIDTTKLHQLTNEERSAIEGCITYEEMAKTVKSMPNNKTPGSDGFPVEFFKFFWKDIGRIVLKGINESYADEEFSFVQREGIITCLPKEGKDKRYLRNWRPITLLNTVYKIASSCIAKRMKTVLDPLISQEQKGFMKGRYIGENIRTLYDIIHWTEQKKIPGLLVIVDFEKAFDTISRKFIVDCLKILGFGPSIIQWVRTCFSYSSARIVQNGYTSNIIQVARGTRQGDPISSYLFVIGVQILNYLCHQNKHIKGIMVNGKEHRILQFADDTEFLLDGSQKSFQATLETLSTFKNISGLKVNEEKTRALWVGSLRDSTRRICQEYKLDWTQGPFNVLGVKFSTNVREIPKLNYEGIAKKIDNILKAWNKRNLTLFGKVKIIKTLGLSKLVYFLINIPRPPDTVLQEINNLCFRFLWDGKPSKIRREIIIQNHKQGGMSMIDLNSFNKSLKISWMKRILLNDEISPCIDLPNDYCKIIQNTGGYVNTQIIKKLNPFWAEVAQSWNDFLCKLDRPTDIRQILSQSVWNNAFFRNKELFNNRWYNLGIRNIGNIFHANGEIKSFNEMKAEFGIDNNFLLYNTIVVNVPKEWKTLIKNNHNNCGFDCETRSVKQMIENQTRNGNRFFYDCLTFNNEHPRGHVKWANIFTNNTLEWNRYHELNKNTIPDTRTRSFQYKIYHHILPTNTMLYKFGIKDSDKCTFCNNEKETLEHVFIDCTFSEHFWNELEIYLSDKLHRTFRLSRIEKIFGSLLENKTVNHILTLARKHIYFSKLNDFKPNMDDFLIYLQQIIKLETFSFRISPNPRLCNEKWTLFI